MPPRGMSKTVQEENTCHLTFLGGKCKKSVDYAENTVDYVEILIANQIDNKAFSMYQTAVKQQALQSFTHTLSSFIE